MKVTTSITKNHIFKRLYAKGKTQVTPFLAMYVLKNSKAHENQNFLGFTVGVKLGNAVTRNKVRRRLREIYRLHESELKTGYQIVVVARNRCATATYSQLEDSFLLLCDQLAVSLHPKHPEKVGNPSKGGVGRKKSVPQGKQTKVPPKKSKEGDLGGKKPKQGENAP